MRAFHRVLLALLMLLPVTAVTAAGDIRLPDRARQGDVIMGTVPPGSEVQHDGRSLRVTAEGGFVLGLDRDAPSSVTVRITRPDRATVKHVISVVPRDYAIQRIDGLPARKVTPRSEADLARIREDARRVRAARERNDPRADFLTGWQWPVTGRISGVYGSQRILNGEPRRPHYGVDIAVPTGTPVRAPADGVVTLAAPDLFFSGGTLILDHGHGLSSAFLHLDRLVVAEGERVRQGDHIADVGATGRVTGPHLDWRMNWFDRRVDPTTLVPPMAEARSD